MTASPRSLPPPSRRQDPLPVQLPFSLSRIAQAGVGGKGNYRHSGPGWKDGVVVTPRLMRSLTVFFGWTLLKALLL